MSLIYERMLLNLVIEWPLMYHHEALMIIAIMIINMERLHFLFYGKH